MNDSWNHYGTWFIKLEDPSSNDEFDNIPRLLGTVLHEMLVASAFVTGVVAMVLVTMGVNLSRLGGIPWR